MEMDYVACSKGVFKSGTYRSNMEEVRKLHREANLTLLDEDYDQGDLA